jgi:hypothetical protein
VAAILFGSVCASAEELDGYRVAGIIFAVDDSIALIEDPSGEQAWFRVGDILDDSLGVTRIVEIDVDSVSLQGQDGQSVLSLRGSKNARQTTPDEELPPASEVSREYQYRGMMSEISAGDAKPGESQAAADTRVMNRVLGLADQARITAIDRVEVATPAEARAELQQRLTSSDPIRISIAGDELKVLYVTPN